MRTTSRSSDPSYFGIPSMVPRSVSIRASSNPFRKSGTGLLGGLVTQRKEKGGETSPPFSLGASPRRCDLQRDGYLRSCVSALTPSFRMITSTRRFCVLPALVSLLARGNLFPYPTVVIRLASIPSPTRLSFTESALLRERARL